jgi:hypothetical protein
VDNVVTCCCLCFLLYSFNFFITDLRLHLLVLDVFFLFFFVSFVVLRASFF